MTLPAALSSSEKHPGATDDELADLEGDLGTSLPEDYRRILRESNGAEGFFGNERYLVLWRTSDIASLNASYSVQEFLPGVILFGTDGSDTGYGFTRSAGVQYVSVPLVGMAPEEMLLLGSSFSDFLHHLSI